MQADITHKLSAFLSTLSAPVFLIALDRAQSELTVHVHAGLDIGHIRDRAAEAAALLRVSKWWLENRARRRLSPFRFRLLLLRSPRQNQSRRPSRWRPRGPPLSLPRLFRHLFRRVRWPLQKPTRISPSARRSTLGCR